MKALQLIKPDWKWASSERSRELDRLLDRQLTFREKLEWLEEAEALSLRLRAHHERQSERKRSRRTDGNSKAQAGSST